MAGAQAFRRFTTKIIGLVGFEPTASWSRTRRDTKLRYSPFSEGNASKNVVKNICFHGPVHALNSNRRDPLGTEL